MTASLERERFQRARSLVFLDQARIQAWQRLLFVQCGDGWIVEEAWRRVRRGYACGVDTSAALVARATALRGIAGTLEFQTWDGSRLPYPNGFFQCVMSPAAFRRRADPGLALLEMHRVVQPGGDVYLLCPPDLVEPLLPMLGPAGLAVGGALTTCEIDLSEGERAVAAVIHARASG